MDQALPEEVRAILREANDMTIATARSDGYPQATTVSYAHEDITIYFGTAADLQKARNIASNNKVSLTINLPYGHWGEIRGLSISGRSERLAESSQVAHAVRLLFQKFPQGVAEYMSGASQGAAFYRVVPEFISVLNYSKGIGHRAFVSLSGADPGSSVGAG